MTEVPDEQYCYLTTVGRRTGRPHTIEIWFGAHPSGSSVYLLCGEGDGSDWVKNLMAERRVHLRIGDQAWDTVASVVIDAEEDALARRLLATKYQSWRESAEMSGWAKAALPVAIAVPEATGSSGASAIE